mmetsp:Transcript_1001/g.2430  ORF Transcript_1001/g.2430 Transcript_1001/m.2430 type:complete len:206 (-) Transcript_1001:30-647(-)
MTSASTVPMSSSASVENFTHDNVDDDAATGDNEHDFAIDIFRMQHSLDRLVDEDPGQAPNEENGEQSTQNFCSVKSERHSGACGTGSNPEGEDGDHEACHVGEQMSGIGHNGQRVSVEATNNFSCHKQQAQARGDPELSKGLLQLLLGILRSMVMIVFIVVTTVAMAVAVIVGRQRLLQVALVDFDGGHWCVARAETLSRRPAST